MGMQAPKAGSAMSDINVTPLVDVMLVLLIIFMIATPLIERERSKQELQENRDRQQRLVALNLPVKATAPVPPDQQNEIVTVKLKVTAGLVVTLDNKPVADCSAARNATDKQEWVPCFDKVEAALIGDPRAKEFGVTVDAEPAVPFGFVVGTLHRLHAAQVTKVGMLPRR